MEVTVGVEPTNGGFANRSLRPLGNVTIFIDLFVTLTTSDNYSKTISELFS